MTEEPNTPEVSEAVIEYIKATPEALALLPPIPVDPPKRKPEKVTDASRRADQDVWTAIRSDGTPFLHRTLAGAEGWIREGEWPSGPDGLPVSIGAMIALGIPEPPGGTLADVYAAPNDGAMALRAALDGRNYVLNLGPTPLKWTMTVMDFGPSTPAPEVPPAASVRLQRIRDAHAEGREI